MAQLKDSDQPESANDEKPEPRKKRFGCGTIGCLSVIILIVGYGITSMILSTPQAFGDKHLVIKDINRFEKQYNRWPKSLEELKAKLPDFQFKERYGYNYDEKMFIVSYEGSGLGGDDSGEFYRSDKGEWKNIYSNRTEYNELVGRLQ